MRVASHRRRYVEYSIAVAGLAMACLAMGTVFNWARGAYAQERRATDLSEHSFADLDMAFAHPTDWLPIEAVADRGEVYAVGHDGASIRVRRIGLEERPRMFLLESWFRDMGPRMFPGSVIHSFTESKLSDGTTPIAIIDWTRRSSGGEDHCLYVYLYGQRSIVELEMASPVDHWRLIEPLFRSVIKSISYTGKPLPEGSSRWRSVRIPMRDGKSLAASVYVPEHARDERSGTVLIQTPYNRLAFVSRAGAELFGDAFAYVVVDMRGYGESKDEGKAWSSGGADGYDVVEWIAAQRWSNGKVGTWGASAVAAIQYETAVEHPPHLTCCVPIVRNLRNDYIQYFPGGVFREDYHRTRELALRMPHLSPSVYRDTAEWQKPGQPADRAAQINVPMLFIGGWFDHNTQPDGYGILQSFKDVQEHGGPNARGHQRILMGPWTHTTTEMRHVGELDFPTAERAGLRATERFYRYWLNGEANGLNEEPPVQYFLIGRDEWRQTASWPPQGVKEQTLYLALDGTLRVDEPDGEGSPRCYDDDPSHPCPTVGGPDVGIGASPVKWGPYDQAPKVESRPDVLIFSTDPLERDLVVLGAPRVRLYVSSDRSDTDFMVRFCDVYPDGRSILLLDTALRMRFRESLAQEKLMTPGQVYEVKLQLPNTAVAFLKGHRVRLSVSSSNWPRFDVNPNTGGPLFDQSNPVVARNCVYADSNHPSALVLPVEPN